MGIEAKIILTILLIMLTTGIVGLIGSIFEKEKLCGIAAVAFFVEVFLLIAVAMIFIWIVL